ncbi:probable inactive receptor kinase At5g10020 [Phragmites australis]|uniref:probable inactive receptor kinase At5g10020 n=1 Tax=Phragmites australis TaxID=29695 RepID=UPI002D78D67A|nr:probable inactive receptor kinase At5g10020 [Phragmites australis]
MRLIFLCLSIWAVAAAASGAGLDMEALLEFGRGIRQDPSRREVTPWNPTSALDSDGCPVDWYGVQCSGGQILSIVFDGIGLVGNASLSALARMPMLRNLSLSGNKLEGVLPPELGSMASLQLLDLSSNRFSGPIPSELTKLAGLGYLNLSSNGFGGVLPLGFQNLRKLKYLDLRGNGFTGKLDGIFAQLQSPIHVDLSCNQFSGSLTSVSDNSSVFSTLQYLNISHNVLSGPLFESAPMPLFDILQVFDASFNMLIGNIPQFNFMISLKVLCLQNNNFSGSIPEALFRETSMVLTELDLSCNQLTGPIRRVTAMNLKYLNLSCNNLHGTLPITFGSCSVIDLSRNMLSGNLSVVRTWGNYLQMIDLSSNRLTGTWPDETTQFLRLTSLRISNNLLAGELPTVLGTYPELIAIDLSLNQLHGPLPGNLFTAVKLTFLNLSGNSFAGTLPLAKYDTKNSTSIDLSIFPVQTSNLSFVDLSNNSLNGSLPTGIDDLTALTLLNLHQNNFTGQIPKTITKLKHLLYIDLSNNHFNGSIPDGLPDELVEFNVSNNNLSGSVPSNLLKFPDSSFHPGNELLVLPRSESPNDPDKSAEGRHGMKRGILYALIVCVVVFVTGIIVLLLVHWKINSWKSSGKCTGQSKQPATQGQSVQRSAETLTAEMHDVSLGSSPTAEYGAISLPGKERQHESQDVPADAACFNEPTGSSSALKDITKSSMPSLTSSPPDARAQHHHSILRVHSPDKLIGDLHLFDNSVVFTAEELSRAPAEIIGRSCHGTSYKATLDNGCMLTVKWLKEGFAKSKKEFSREIKKLGSVKHPNLISLRGYYWGPKEHERIIISDYVDATSLSTYLSELEERNLPPLSVGQRLDIAIDIARCIDYLHNERVIPHGNIKSSNVLIQNSTPSALVTDYSLHRLMTPIGMAEQVLNAGALGYSPPEFSSTSKPCPSLKSDVYAFGVILLELLTGKIAGEIICVNDGVVDLTDWVRMLALEERVSECYDRHIVEAESSEGAPKALDDMLRIAIRCIRSASERPEIRTVFEDLSSLSS